MPFVIVEMWDGRTVDQKRNLVRAITDAMVDHAACKPDHLHVVIHETAKDSWARAGILGIDEATETSTTGAREGDGTHILIPPINTFLVVDPNVGRVLHSAAATRTWETPNSRARRWATVNKPGSMCTCSCELIKRA